MQNSKELQWFGAVLGSPFCFLGATGALLTPEGSPGTGKVVRDPKNCFWCPGDASDPTGQDIEAAFPVVCAWVPQGPHESKFQSKKSKTWCAAMITENISEFNIFVFPAAPFEKHNENQCFLKDSWGVFLLKS